MAEMHPLLRIGTSSWSNAVWPLYAGASIELFESIFEERA